GRAMSARVIEELVFVSDAVENVGATAVEDHERVPRSIVDVDARVGKAVGSAERADPQFIGTRADASHSIALDPRSGLGEPVGERHRLEDRVATPNAFGFHHTIGIDGYPIAGRFRRTVARNRCESTVSVAKYTPPPTATSATVHATPAPANPRATRTTTPIATAASTWLASSPSGIGIVTYCWRYQYESTSPTVAEVAVATA